MATIKKDKEIPNLSEDWKGYLGKWVQKLIKDNLISLKNGKLGYLDQERQTDGLTTWRFFASEESYRQWYDNKEQYADNVLAEQSFYSSKPASDHVLKASIVKYPQTTIVKGAENTLTLNYNSYYDEPSDPDTEAGTLTVTINGEEIKELEQSLQSSGNAQGKNYTVDLTNYLTSETNTVKLTVKNQYGKSRTFTFTIQTIDITLSFDNSYNETAIRNGAWALRVNLTGIATVYCKVTDGDKSETMTMTINNSSGEFTIDRKGTYAAGKHDIEVWAVNSEYDITTDTIRSSYIKSGSVAAIAIGKDAPKSATEYNTVQIPYFFYLPDEQPGTQITVNVKVLYNDGADETELTDQIVTLDDKQTSGDSPIIASVPLDVNGYAPKVSVVVSIGDVVSATHEITIKSAGVTLQPVSECKVYYSMKGRTNSDKGIEDLESFYNGVRTSYLQRSDNFKLNAYNGFLDGQGMTIGAGKTVTLKGWQPFAEDFGANGTQRGRTVEIEFETGICSDENTVIIDCMDDTTGFRVYANRIEVRWGSGENVVTYFPETKRIKFSLSIDGTTTHTRNDLGGGNVTEKDENIGYLCINGVCVRMFDYTSAKWKQGTPKDIVIGSDMAQVILYSIRGYEKAINPYQALDNYAYDTPDVEDVYDSNGDFDHYGKINIAKRNDILNSQGDIHKPHEIISYAKVKKALPMTPIIVWNIDNLPYNKNNKDVPINGTTFENPQWNKTKDGWAMAPFTVGAHMFNADGTSSNGHPLPYKNWAEIFTDGKGAAIVIIVGLEGETDNHTTYSITIGIVDSEGNELGEKEMVHKVNFASSEGIFNIHAMNMFQQILLACAKGNNALYTAFQKEQADKGETVTFRKSLSGFPEIGFRRTSTSGSAAPTFLSIYNFINNKYSASFLGFPAKDYTKGQIWEVDENVNMFNQTVTDNTVDSEGKVTMSLLTGRPLYYARVPKKSPTNKSRKLGTLGVDEKTGTTTDNVEASNDELAVIKHFHNWVVSTNVLLAERYKREHGDYETLASPVVYNGTTYRKDNPAYRRAKFTAEADDYLKVDSALFYFNFCQYIIGMDSMDKNMSLAFDDIVWQE